MGRYDFRPQNIYKTTAQLLSTKRLAAAPPSFTPIGATPPSTRLVRPPLQRPQRSGKKSSKLFKPLSLKYSEDQLRWEYYNDHPWELARPRVVLEDDGRDSERWDWSVPLDYSLRRPMLNRRDGFGRGPQEWDTIMQKQSCRPINGEA